MICPVSTWRQFCSGLSSSQNHETISRSKEFMIVLLSFLHVTNIICPHYFFSVNVILFPASFLFLLVYNMIQGSWSHSPGSCYQVKCLMYRCTQPAAGPSRFVVSCELHRQCHRFVSTGRHSCKEKVYFSSLNYPRSLVFLLELENQVNHLSLNF
jgi:hypothetical protein